MRRHILSIMMAMALAMGVASCELERDHNGDLAGYWHLERVDTLQTGGVKDMSRDRVFWAVQGKLLYLRDADHPDSCYFMRFVHSDGYLALSQPYYYGWHQDTEDGGDHPVTEARWLSRFGINALEEKYNAEQLNASRMTLATDRLRLHFKKF